MQLGSAWLYLLCIYGTRLFFGPETRPCPANAPLCEHGKCSDGLELPHLDQIMHVVNVGTYRLRGGGLPEMRCCQLQGHSMLAPETEQAAASEVCA